MSWSYLRKMALGGLLSLAALLGCRARQGPALAKSACKWNATVVNESIEAGNLIVGALERWHASVGRFPEALSDLVPAYLPSLPAPTAGTREWRYVCVESGLEYGLSFGCVVPNGRLSPSSGDDVSFYPSATTGSKTLAAERWYVNE